MHKRTGVVYVAVLMASLVVASLTMAALHSARYFGRSLNDDSDYGRCQLSADAGLEWAVARINAEANWRTSHVNNVDIPAPVMNGVNIRYRLIDSDGDLNDDSRDSCDLLLTASTTTSTCTWRAALAAAGPALKCMYYAVATADDLIVKSLSVVSTDANVASDRKVDVNAGGSLTGNSYTKDGSIGAVYGTIQPLIGSLEVPEWEHLSYYITNGTTINSALLPVSLGKLQLKGQLLSHSSNTISGTLNPMGVYVIDCGGDDIVISNSRLKCTLVLVDAGGGSVINGAVNWEAAQPNYPALLVQGKIELQLSNSPLYESVAGRNLNPPETPFRGQSDANSSTIYPSQIKGLIYASDDLTSKSLTAKTQVVGTIVGKKRLEVTGTLTVHARNLFSLDPPPGFANFDKVRIAKGTIRRVAAP